MKLTFLSKRRDPFLGHQMITFTFQVEGESIFNTSIIIPKKWEVLSDDAFFEFLICHLRSGNPIPHDEILTYEPLPLPYTGDSLPFKEGDEFEL